jgi:hypothetical protein
MRLDNALDLYVEAVTSWWVWTMRRLRYGAEVTASDMAESFARANVVPTYKA